MSFFNNKNISTTQNVNKDIEIQNAPGDTISCLRFGPNSLPKKLLLSGSWDKSVRIWEIDNNGSSKPIMEKVMDSPVMDACWSTDGQKVFVCGVSTAAYAWDLSSNQITQIAIHDSSIRTIHYIQTPNYSCIMTGGWDKKLKFWDLKNEVPIKVMELSDRVYCADVIYPLVAVATADKKISLYKLEPSGPIEYKQIDSPLKYQSRCIRIFRDKATSQPSGYALGSIEGRVSIQNIVSNNLKDTFTFKCHRTPLTNSNTQDIYAVNDIAIHPLYQTLATVGSDGLYTFWDKDARTKISSSSPTEPQSITACDISYDGIMFAYAFGYDWSKGHEYNDLNKKPRIFIHSCIEDMKNKK